MRNSANSFNRGYARRTSSPSPPFPAVKGLFSKPTLLNNVETYANIPQIILRELADWFAKMEYRKEQGTKVFALGGKISNTGLVEIPMGTTLREVVFNIGGGIPGGKAFRLHRQAVLGRLHTCRELDVPIDYDNLVAIGSMIGSGGMIIMDEDNCMVNIAKFFLEFTVDESCGKCPPAA